MTVTRSLSRRAATTTAGAIDQAFAAFSGRDDTISFATGAPDSRLLPVALLAQLTRVVLARSTAAAVLQYGPTAGYPPLIELAAAQLRQRCPTFSADALHISTGASGALGNTCLALLDPGDVVLVETPTYPGAVKAFTALGADVVAVRCDAEGLDPIDLDRRLAATPRAVVYAMPTFQNPSGRTASRGRRQQIMDVIVNRGTFLIEDDVYFDLRYRDDPLPPLWSFAPEHVVYLTSLSKVVAPALRTGIAAIPQRMRAPFLALKEGIDMQTSLLTQAFAAEFLAHSGFADHLGHLRATYAGRLDALCGALERHLPGQFTWSRPDGGLFLWISGPDDLDGRVLAKHAIEDGVAFVPGSAFQLHTAPRHNDIRLSFSGTAEDEIVEGIRRLAVAYARISHG